MIDKAHIGMELEPVTFPVERGKVRELARAIHDDNPVYFDSEHPPAPLIFSRTFIAWSDNLVDAFARIGVDLSRILHGGFELEYLEPVNAGETTLSAPALKSRPTADSSLARATILTSLLRSRAVKVMYRLSGSDETAHTMPRARSMPAPFKTSSFVASPINTM